MQERTLGYHSSVLQLCIDLEQRDCQYAAIAYCWFEIQCKIQFLYSEKKNALICTINKVCKRYNKYFIVVNGQLKKLHLSNRFKKPFEKNN